MVDLSTASAHVAFTARVSTWLAKAGVTDPDARATLAVGLVDFLAAAREVEAQLEAALDLDTDIPEEADEALTHIGGIPAWLFGEARDHANEMEPLWEDHLEVPLASKGLPENDDPRE
jgi:hypothetical protein